MEFLKYMGRRVSYFRQEFVGVEIRKSAIHLVCLEKKKKRWYLKKAETLPLEDGLLHPSFAAPNISDPDIFLQHLRRAVAGRGGNVSRAGLALPDELIRIFIQTFPRLPESGNEIRRMIRWWVEKTLKISSEEILISPHLLGNNEKGESRVLIALASKTVIREYEMLFKALKTDPELIHPAGISTYNYYCDEIPPAGNATYLAIRDDAASLMMTEEGIPSFYQCLRTESDNLLHRIEIIYENYMETDGDSRPPLQRDQLFLAVTEKSDPVLEKELADIFTPNIIHLQGRDDMIPDGNSEKNAPVPAIYSAAIGAALGLESVYRK